MTNNGNPSTKGRSSSGKQKTSEEVRSESASSADGNLNETTMIGSALDLDSLSGEDERVPGKGANGRSD